VRNLAAGFDWRAPALCSWLLLASCSAQPERAPLPRLVVLYVSCTVNKAFLAPYAPAVRYTPNLQAFAAESVVFRRHVTEAGQSGIDFATLFSGTQADGHGIYHHPARLDEANQLVAESFAAAGYDTWFFSGHPMASVELNYGQGVAPEHALEHALPFPKSAKRTYSSAILERLTANTADFSALLARLAAEPDYRAFVQIAFTVSHEPYDLYVSREQVLDFARQFPEAAHGVTPAELERWLAVYAEERHALNWDFADAVQRLGLSSADVERLAAVLELVYAACIHEFDGYFGRFLAGIQASGLAGESVFAFTADHGELLRRANARFQWTHGLELCTEVLEVPWILRAPGLRPSAYGGVSRSIDVMPTLLGLCGLPIPSTCAGTDLAPALRGESPPPRLLGYSHTALWPEERIRQFAGYAPVHSILPANDPQLLSVRIRDEDRVFKLLHRPEGEDGYEAYDLSADPGETRDLFDRAQEEHRRMAEELARYKERLIAGFDPSGRNSLSEEETLEYLRSLGYAR
jgi:arylsulfatase A-like enzyme